MLVTATARYIVGTLERKYLPLHGYPMKCIHLSNGLTILEALRTGTNEKEGPSLMVRKIGSLVINFGTLEWVNIRLSEQTKIPIYTFHFVSGCQYDLEAIPPVRLDIEKALAEWQGIRFDPTNSHTVEIPAIHKTNLLNL